MGVAVFNIHQLKVLLLVVILQSSAQAAPTGVKATHLEELLIWKVSDELKLKPAEEKSFAEIIKKLNLEKAQLSENIQKEISALKDEKSEKNLQALLKNHRKSISNYSRLTEKEFDQLSKLLGPQRMSQYLVIKQDITQRIKSLLSTPENKSTPANLPPPKFIE